ncbi:MAG: DUF3568 family protein [Verrucomicrobiota bacterium]
MKTSRPSLAACSALLLGLAAILFSSGCLAVAAGAGAGAVAYVRGDLNATLEGSLDQTVRAASRAVQQLEFVKVSESKDALLGLIVVRTAADVRVEIKVERVGDHLSKVNIRAGIFGDEKLSLAVLDKIKSNL